MYYRGNFGKTLLKISIILAVSLLLLAALYINIFGFYSPTIPSRDFLGPRTPVTEWFKPGNLPDGTADWIAFNPRALTTTSLLNPASTYAPGINWWWPGGDVSHQRLRTELARFSAKGFGSVTIHPSIHGIDAATLRHRSDRINSFNTEDYHYRIASVLREAERLDMRVDLHGSPSPLLGGDFVALKDSQRTLAWSTLTITGGTEHAIEIPEPHYPPSTHNAFTALGLITSGGMPNLRRADARPISILVGKVQHGSSHENNPWSTSPGQSRLRLDPDSIREVASRTVNGVLQWNFPPGEWVLVSTWLTASGTRLSGYPSALPALAIDHFDSGRVQGILERLFGENTQLPDYRGEALRAVVNGDYEFDSQQLASEDFLDQFRIRRQYDLTPWLPALTTSTDNQATGIQRLLSRLKQTAVYFGYLDKRIRHDYQHTISELFIERFLHGTRDWLQARKLGHRTRAYGFDLDIIRAAGETSIPEIDARGIGHPNGLARLVGSGSLLYGRPLVSAELGKISLQQNLPTPATNKRALDLLAVSGFNHTTFSGIPYPYEETDSAWNPLSGGDDTSYLAQSVLYGPAYPYWRYQEEVNLYASRMHYLMQSGPEDVDVLIYYPFLGYAPGDAPENQRVGVADAAESPDDGSANSSLVRANSQAAWWTRILSIIATLETHGLRWAFANDDSLQVAQIDESHLDIRGNRVLGILVARAPHIHLQTAVHLAELDDQGADIQILGPAPAHQPGFHEYAQRDSSIEKSMHMILANQSFLDEKTLVVWVRKLVESQRVRYLGPHPGTKRISRRASRGNVHFFLNTTEEDRVLKLSLDTPANRVLFYDPARGVFHRALEPLEYPLGPYEGIVLLEKTGPLNNLQTEPVTTQVRKVDVSAWQAELEDTRTVATPGSDTHIVSVRYRTKIDLSDLASGDLPILHLPSSINGAGNLVVNGKHCANMIFLPFRQDLSGCIVEGLNLVETRFDLVLPSLPFAGEEKGVEAGRLELEKLVAGLMSESYLTIVSTR